jgi:phosphate transport system protein
MGLSIAPARDPNAEVLSLVELTMQACASAKASVSHSLDSLVQGDRPALEAVRECEEKLDQMDRELDQRLVSVIALVGTAEVRELLACMKVMLDLERIGDLVLSFAERAAIVRNRLEMQDLGQLTNMACMLENMLNQAAKAFTARDVTQALNVIRSDSEIDRLRNLLLIRHTENTESLPVQESLHVLFMATALERAGDHVKNIAEETCHLATGHTVRHLMRQTKNKSTEQLFIDWLSKQPAENSKPS